MTKYSIVSVTQRSCGGRRTDLCLEGLARLQHVQQFRVVNLEQYASDLAGHVRIHAVDQREQALTEHLLLLLRRRFG